LDSERPRVAIVIPTLNEERALGRLLADLRSQRDVELEILISDGESHDGTLRVCEDFAGCSPHSIRWVRTRAGRGRQMNAGAGATRSPDLLFLHADTEIEGPLFLARAAERLERERAGRASHRVAGHFGLSFRRTTDRNDFAYRFFEAKTRLNRPGCVNGDQGFWLSRTYFEELRGFDESLPFLEDSQLASRVFATGVWITLPGRLFTSDRRFAAEGFGRRHLLNVLIRAFEVVDPSFFRQAAGLYERHDRAERLDLRPFFELAHRIMRGGKLSQTAANWYRVGAYTRTQAWQIAFALDCLINRRRRMPPAEGQYPCLAGFDSWFDRLTDNLGGRIFAGLLALIWFYGTLASLRARHAV